MLQQARVSRGEQGSLWITETDYLWSTDNTGVHVSLTNNQKCPSFSNLCSHQMQTALFAGSTSFSKNVSETIMLLLGRTMCQ